MNVAHRIALDPTVKQRHGLARAAGVARFVWNWALAEWNRQYSSGEKPTAAKLKLQFNAIKRAAFPWIYDSPKGANQQPFSNLGTAFGNFFQGRAKRPSFKKKGEHDSFYIENDKLAIEGLYARLPKIGRVRLREELRFTGRILSATVSRTADRWFLSVSVEVPSVVLPRTGDDVVGVDLGLSTFAKLSTGEPVHAPKPLKKALSALRRAQRRVARRKKGSHRRTKAKARVARIHARVSNIRTDFLHKLSSRLVRENQAVVLEDLAVKNLVKNRKLARSISDAGWGELQRQVAYKAPAYGCLLILADRFFPSSRMCSHCGVVKETLALKDRIFRCDACGLEIDRDLNAALNLRAAGLAVVHARGRGSSGDPMQVVKLPRMKRELNRGALALTS